MNKDDWSQRLVTTPPHMTDSFDLPEGPIEIRYPQGIKRGSIDEIGDFLALVLKKMQRLSSQPKPKPKGKP